MKFLVVSAVFPPDVIGGAEVSASNLARWLAGQGHEVHVLTTAKAKDEVCDDKLENGLHIWRVWMPRLYPMFHFAKAKGWQKPLWHLQDHFDPRNQRIMARVLDEVKPDFINLHVMQGLGFNGLKEIAKRKIPVLHFLPDVALACIRMAMFKGDKDCVGLCKECKCSRDVKLKYMRTLPKVGFCSPSRFNLEKVAKYFPVKEWPYTSILNPNKYPDATVAHEEPKQLRVLYVGQLSKAKGVDVLLEAAQRVAAKGIELRLMIAGRGPMEAELRTAYEGMPWVEFLGFISHQEQSNIMVRSTVMAIPSVWDENSPGVVIHALGQGLPVLGSDKAGIPELVKHDENGLLVTPGSVDAWADALELAARNPKKVALWRKYALAHAAEFEQDYLGQKIMDFIQTLRGVRS